MEMRKPRLNRNGHPASARARAAIAKQMTYSIIFARGVATFPIDSKNGKQPAYPGAPPFNFERHNSTSSVQSRVKSA
jgi:hypothetical protein